MSLLSTILLVICISITLCNNGQGAPILDDLFSGFIRDSQLTNEAAKTGTIVKRRIYADNPDSRLKQISLQSLIGDVEDSLFNTALSVSSVAHNHEAIVPEVTPNTDSIDGDERTITKRQTEEAKVNGDAIATTTTAINSDVNNKNGQFVTTTTPIEVSPSSKNILLQTTQKVPAANGIPAHILIDRVAIQPHEGGLPFIPAFQVYHTKVISATFKEPNTNVNNDDNSGSTSGTKSTKISIAQTAVQTTNTGANTVPVITISTTNPIENNPSDATTTTTGTATTIHLQNIPITTTTTTTTNAAGITAESATTESSSISASTSADSASTTSTTTTSSTTTKLPIVQLKEAEEELKEKVAEIEAEPVILTARV